MLGIPQQSPARESTTIDPIIVEIIRHGLQSIPDELETDITRTAFSPLIYEYKDYAVGIVDAEGALICQSRGGIPIFLANVLGLAVRDGLAIYGRDRMEPGDVMISNHAGTFGQHLNNVIMYTPVFDPEGDRGIVAFVCVLVHWTDVGGRYVGSSASNDTTEIFQEGFQFRTVKLRRRGEPVPEMYRIIECNTRLPHLVLGDLDAQLAACVKGARLFDQLLARHGTETLFDAVLEIWRQSEQAARDAVLAIPDGTYQARSFLDNDGVDLETPITIDIKVTIDGERFIIDLSDIADEVRGPFNSGKFGGGITAARIAFKYLTTPSESTNEGSFRPLEVILPDGKLLSAGPNAALARYSTPLATVIDTIVRAMADAAPQRVVAGHHASMGSHRFQGIHPASSQLYSHLDTAHGGWGASETHDGAGPFKTLAHGDTLDVPVEAQEALYPFTLDYLRRRPDSGGPGRRRGGLGIEKRYTIRAPCKLTVTFERYGCPPWGLLGGQAATPGYAEIEYAGREGRRRVLKETDMPLAPGDRVYVFTAGGGGFGSPLEREPGLVADDVLRGYVSAEAARSAYGVVFDAGGAIDHAATMYERDGRRGQKAS